MEIQSTFTTKFATFLEAYCGTKDSEQQFEQAKDSLFGSDNYNITDYELKQNYDETVEIHIEPLKYIDDCYAELKLFFCNSHGVCLEFSCDCMDYNRLVADCLSIASQL